MREPNEPSGRASWKLMRHLVYEAPRAAHLVARVAHARLSRCDATNAKKMNRVICMIGLGPPIIPVWGLSLSLRRDLGLPRDLSGAQGVTSG